MALGRALLAAAGLLLGGLASAALPAPVAAVLDRHGLDSQGLSIWVAPLDGGEPLLAQAADVPRNPASVMKLVTTLAGLELLGPTYQWRTEALVTGPVRDGRLQGDLVIRGYGDPYLLPESVWRLARGIQEAGVTHVTGRLLLDASHFAPEDTDRDAFDGRGDRAYNAPPAALMANFQALRLGIRPAPQGPARITTDPPLANLQIEDALRLVDGRCRSDISVSSRELDGQILLRLGGELARSCPEQGLVRVVASAPTHFAGAFLAQWQALGGHIEGGWRTGGADGQRLYSLESRPLAEQIRGMNKYSNNVMTRQLLLTLGASRHGAPGTEAKGREAVLAWLAGQGVATAGMVLDNGAGLSREARASARQLGAVLLAGYRSRYMPEFMSSLALAGMDGTLARRFVDAPEAGRMHLKSGSLNDVRSVAGYVLAASGRRYGVVVLHERPGLDAAAARALQDALLAWVHAH